MEKNALIDGNEIFMQKKENFLEEVVISAKEKPKHYL